YDDHAACSKRKAGMEPPAFLDESGSKRSQNSAGVDRHVEVRETSVSPGIGLVLKHEPHDRGDVRFQCPSSKNDEDEPDRQTGQARDYCEADVAESNDDSADEHKVLRAENPLPQPRTHQLSDIDRSPVGTDNSCRFRRPQGEAALVKLVEEVERQDALEAVEREPFP